MAAQWGAARWAAAALGLAALLGALVVLAYPATVPAVHPTGAMIPCGSGISINAAHGDYAGACSVAVGDQRMLAIFLAAIGVLIFMSRAKLMLSPTTRAPHREPGRPDWVTVG